MTQWPTYEQKVLQILRMFSQVPIKSNMSWQYNKTMRHTQQEKSYR